MASLSPSEAQAIATSMPLFPRILCGVNGGRPARHAMRARSSVLIVRPSAERQP